MILLIGIHGSGKTSFANNLKLKYGIEYFTASSLINEKKVLMYAGNKRIKDIDNNQEILIESVDNKKRYYKNFILDGHCCLINEQGNIERIKEDYIKRLNPSRIIIIYDDIENIQNRLQKRDDVNENFDLLEILSAEERAYAAELGKKMKIPVNEIKFSYNLEDMLNQYRIVSYTNNSILLPVHPTHIKNIFNGNKKYEYRKKLSIKEINKMILYETSPTKKIVGEVEVLDKIYGDKEAVWKRTLSYSGINKTYYDKYFDKSTIACAYHLGVATEYSRPLELKELGIYFTPQSFVYLRNGD